MTIDKIKDNMFKSNKKGDKTYKLSEKEMSINNGENNVLARRRETGLQSRGDNRENGNREKSQSPVSTSTFWFFSFHFSTPSAPVIVFLPQPLLFKFRLFYKPNYDKTALKKDARLRLDL